MTVSRFVCFAAFCLNLSSLAQAQSDEFTGSITSIAPKIAMQGKLATKTEIIPDRGETAMISLGSLTAHDNAIAAYEEIVAGGGWPQLNRSILEAGKANAEVVTLRQRLIVESYMAFDALNVEAPEKYDEDVKDGVKAFQVAHGIAPTGKVDIRTRAEMNIAAEARLFTLRQNRPRVVAYLEGLGARYILVNLPSAQLETVELGKVYSRHNVIVGKLERPSPALKSTVSDVNFNPYWNAPASIVERDLIPKFLKDPTIFEQMQIRIFDGVGGPEVDPYSVDWANTPPDRFHFRQEPGAQNAMAKVKINFPNTHMVYMHDTPNHEPFSSNARFESSGCVRIDKVESVVDWILNGQDGFNKSQFKVITASEEPQDMKVAMPPDIRFMYLTSWATEDGRIHFRPDFYSLDGTGFIYGQPEPVGGT